VKPGGLEIKWYYQLLVYAYNVHILGGSIHTIQKNKEPLVVPSKEIGLEVNANKTKYRVIFRDQNKGQIHNLKTDNISFEMVELYKYLGTTLIHTNSIQQDIQSSMNSGNVCYHLVQDLFSFSLLTQNIIFFCGAVAQLGPLSPHS